MEELFRYSLSKEDYLEYFLYSSSTNKKTKAKRRRNWIILTTSFCCLTFAVFFADSEALKVPVTVFTLATIFLYPLYEKRQFKKHYTQYIENNYANRINTMSDLLIADAQIIMTDKTGETKLNKNELTEVIETGKYFYIGISTGGHILLPKYKIENLAIFEKAITLLSSQYQLPFTKDLTWRW